MFRWASLVFCMTVFAALAALTVMQAASLEGAVIDQVADGLSTAGVRSASIDADGLDVTVRGIAASDIVLARSIVGSVDGVRSVVVTEADPTTDRVQAPGPTGEIDVSTEAGTVPRAIEQVRPRVIPSNGVSGTVASTAAVDPYVVADVVGGVVYLRGSVRTERDRAALARLDVDLPLRSRVMMHPGGHPTDPSPVMVDVFADVVEVTAGDLDGGQLRLFGSLIEVRGRLSRDVKPSDLRFAVELVAAGRSNVMFDVEPWS